MNQRRIFVLGANGQLGTALRAQMPDALFTDRDEFDITDPKSYTEYDWSAVDVLINAAAYTAVDAAETSENRPLAWLLNATAVGLMADAANQHNLTLVHISSDYVFNGSETEHLEDEPFSPLGVYGQTKAAGDIAALRATKHYVVRTSWVVGSGKNFVRTMAELAAKGVAPKVVGDQRGRLTFTSDLADGIIFLLSKRVPFGTYNISNGGDIASWAEIAQAVFTLAGKSADQVTAITTEEYFKDKPAGSPRPLNSALNLRKVTELGFVPRDWRVALEEYLKEMK